MEKETFVCVSGPCNMLTLTQDNRRGLELSHAGNCAATGQGYTCGLMHSSQVRAIRHSARLNSGVGSFGMGRVDWRPIPARLPPFIPWGLDIGVDPRHPARRNP